MILLLLAKQTFDNSLQACVDRYWTEILLNSFVFDRNNREVNFIMIQSKAFFNDLAQCS
jgi:hypothetical protein